MSLKSYNSMFQPAIDAEMRKVIQSSRLDAYSGLKDMMEYHLGWLGEGAGSDAQGKRIRPLLVLLTAEAVGGTWRHALPAAAAVEILHNFSLIHDDIEDRSILRRGRKTIWAIWGEALAINSGDAMFALAYDAIGRLSVTTNFQAAMRGVEILTETNIRLTGGQHLDISYENQTDVPLDAYWAMIGGKTAALLSACTRLGAISGGASEDQVEILGVFGEKLGLAFQVIDDWLGIWGNSTLIGKSNESDLVSGKKSLPILLGIQSNAKFAARWAEGNIKAGEAAQMAQWLEEEGVSQQVQSIADQLTAEALQALENAQIDNSAGKALRELSELLLSREK